MVRGRLAGEYERLTTGDRSPLIDRVTGVAQPPASTFKAVTLPGAVAAGADLDDEVNCTASHRIGDRTFNNFESRAYGWITWREAIKVSCDTVFYRVAEDVWRDQGGLSARDDDGDALIDTARDLGLGRRPASTCRPSRPAASPVGRGSVSGGRAPRTLPARRPGGVTPRSPIALVATT